MTAITGDIWVFGYASLIWRPDFAHTEERRARLHGFHRDLCVYSVEHRGTVAHPGLVFGMDRGGTCDGVALKVPAANARAVVNGLRIREQVTGVYRERVRPVTLHADRAPDGTVRPAESVWAVCYVVDPHHRQYAGGLSLDAQAGLAQVAIGNSGPNVDYITNTYRSLHRLGIRDRRLERLIVLMGLNRLAITGSGCGVLARRIQQVASLNGTRNGPRWSVRSRAELAINHRKNLGY